MFPCENLLLKWMKMEIFASRQLSHSGTLMVHIINAAIASTLTNSHTTPVLIHVK